MPPRLVVPSTIRLPALVPCSQISAVQKLSSPPTRERFKKPMRKWGAKLSLIYMLIFNLFEMKTLFYDQAWSILHKCNLNSNGLSGPQKAQPKTKPNQNKNTWVLLWGSCLLSFLWLRSFISSPLIHHFPSPLFSFNIPEQEQVNGRTFIESFLDSCHSDSVKRKVQKSL